MSQSFDYSASLILSYQASLKKILHKWGQDYRKIPPGNLPYYFHDLVMRLPGSRSRRVHLSDTILESSEKIQTIQPIVRKLENGISIWPHLSRGWGKLKEIDQMYNAWKISHFHINTNIEKDGYVERSKEVLLAIIWQDQAFLIDVRDHGKSNPDLWYSIDLMEIVLRNWPEWMYQYRSNIKQSNTDSSIATTKQFRQLSVNSSLSLSDGNIYMPPGIITAEGLSMFSSMIYNRIITHNFLLIQQAGIEAHDELLKYFFRHSTPPQKLDMYVDGIWPTLTVKAKGSPYFMPLHLIRALVTPLIYRTSDIQKFRRQFHPELYDNYYFKPVSAYLHF